MKIRDLHDAKYLNICEIVVTLGKYINTLRRLYLHILQITIVPIVQLHTL